MMHFFPHARQDHDYPRIKKAKRPVNIYRQAAIKSVENLSHSRFGKALHVSRHGHGQSSMIISRHMSVKGNITVKRKTAVPEFPISEEVIKSITTFCYPGT